MEANGYVCLEEIEEYKYVANQNFNTEEDFFEFYNAYAFHKGFSVRNVMTGKYYQRRKKKERVDAGAHDGGD